MELARVGPGQSGTVSTPGLSAGVGALEFAAGTRLPAEGVSKHEEDELAFILEGELRAVSGGQAFSLRAGDVTLIPAGEEHWAEVVSDVRLVYALVERRARPPGETGAENG